ncbi:unnamed protein product, partial [Tilletia caries]
ARSSDADGDDLLRSKALEAYLARAQVHPMWKVPRLASQNASNALGQALGAGAHKEDHHSTAPPPPSSSKITLSVYASALSASASRWSSLLYAGEERDTTLDSSSSPSSSAAILVQIEGVLQALLTLGLRRDTQRGNGGPPVVVVVHANIRSALEMEPLVDGVTKGGAGAGHSSLVGSAHLSSASTLHRSLSSDLMAFLAHERARPSSNQKKEAEGEGEGDEAEPTWREVGTALMYIRGLRTLEDISVPALPPSHGALQGEEAGAGNARQGSDPSSSASTSPTAVLGFVHFLDAEQTGGDGYGSGSGSGSGGVEDGGGKDATGRSVGFPLGQAPVRWAWCAPNAHDRVQEDGKRGEGEWLAFNYGAAATAPLSLIATGSGHDLFGMTLLYRLAQRAASAATALAPAPLSFSRVPFSDLIRPKETPTSAPALSVPVAIVLGLIASFFQSLGIALQRGSHLQNDAPPAAQRRIGALPIVILAPLGAVSTTLITMGTILIALFGAITESPHSLDASATSDGQASLAPSLADLDPGIRRTKTLLALAYAGASGTLSGACLLLAKSGIELVVLSLTGSDNQFGRWQSWALLGIMLAAAVLQLWYLNKAWRFESPVLVMPLAFCFYNTSSIALGLLYFNQLGSLAWWNILLVILGTIVLLMGMWVVSLHTEEERQPLLALDVHAPSTPTKADIKSRTGTDGDVSPVSQLVTNDQYSDFYAHVYFAIRENPNRPTAAAAAGNGIAPAPAPNAKGGKLQRLVENRKDRMEKLAAGQPESSEVAPAGATPSIKRDESTTPTSPTVAAAATQTATLAGALARRSIGTAKTPKPMLSLSPDALRSSAGMATNAVRRALAEASPDGSASIVSQSEVGADGKRAPLGGTRS